MKSKRNPPCANPKKTRVSFRVTERQENLIGQMARIEKRHLSGFFRDCLNRALVDWQKTHKPKLQ